MSEKIITVNLTGLGFNSFNNVNLLETVYPSNKSYSKALICIETLIADIGESLNYIEVTCQGLINNYEYVLTNGLNRCEPSNVLDVIPSINPQLINVNSFFNHKSYNDKWREISIGNLSNFTMSFKKDEVVLFDSIFVIIKIKLIE